MIFATVGTQLPFDRLLSGLDSWAAANPGVPVFAQTGPTGRVFAHLACVEQMGQAAFLARLGAARLIVSHAGMGTILTAADLGKPVIVMPRRAKFAEHRSDHQLATAAEMGALDHVSVAEDGEALHKALDCALASGFPTVPLAPASGADRRAPLVDCIRDFVWHRPPQRGAAA